MKILVSQVSDMLASMQGTVTFIIIPGHRSQMNSARNGNVVSLNDVVTDNIPMISLGFRIDFYI